MLPAVQSVCCTVFSGLWCFRCLRFLGCRFSPQLCDAFSPPELSAEQLV